MMKLTLGMSIGVLLGLSACASYPDEQNGDGGTALAGTSWELIAFQSMDDSQGKTSPAAGRIYTLEFGSNGQVAMQLDCNRGNANYSEYNGSETGGSLTIGPVAATRALCPPPDMGELLASQLPNVASYTRQDGRLFLALKLDGGIFEFAPR